MAFKLALSAGHGRYTAGKRCLKSLDPNETREWVLNDRIADKIQNILANYDNIEILRVDDTTGEDEVSLIDRSTAANNFKADFYLAIHHNAGINGGSGGGIMAYVYTNASQKSIEWQKELYNTLISKTGLKGNRSSPLAKANFHEVREPYMPAVLLELGFMDSSVDVPIILTDNFATQCAEACVEVIVKMAGLTKKQVSTVGKEYNVVTNINRYSSVNEAKEKVNSKGTYAPGIYYIYNKYPNGMSGMYNISTDKTGGSAGSWINPSENVIKQTVEVEKKLYRVRKSKDDVKSQKGAYSNLDGAIECCQNAGSGYHVFDWDYKIVYSYKVPVVETKPVETPKEETPIVAVYDLDYPEKIKIVDLDNELKKTELERDCVKSINCILSNNVNFDVEIAKVFFKLAPKYGINPMMAIAQSILETGWFKYVGSAVTADQHNYCGLGVTSNGVTGGSFETIEDGVRAQLQHLYAYGCKDALPNGEEKIVDPRFKYVTRGIAPYWQNLAGRWAVPGYDKNTYATPADAMKAGNTYGQKISAICARLISVDVNAADIEKYFTYNDVIKNNNTKDHKSHIDINYIFKILVQIFEAIMNVFKNVK